MSSGGRDQDEAEGEVDIAEIIFSHIGDSHEWHITEWKGRPVAIPLPVIVWSKYSGWHCFSSEKLDGKQYQGFFIGEDEKIFEITPDGIKRPFDISITKNVLSLMMSSALLLLLVLLSARWYRRHDVLKEAPRGVAALLEPLVMMVHTMAVENIGKDYRRYLPFLETAFFFILLNNFLGIIPFFPGGANLTGNIAVTMVLAVATFLTVNLFGNKHYYKEIFLPEVPGFLKPIMPVIEVFSALMKPVSLTIRLFANMLAGHVMILAMVCVIFIMAKYGPLLGSSMTVVSVLFGVFLDALECLVAFIQAYVFTMLSSIYIGLSRQNH
ncbi:MAG: F0F1 ATP synthase subunit A [Bacteroidales bacterium]|nr:F0F1 ATP synthase subunit A [Bacteroidales bacterium]